MHAAAPMWRNGRRNGLKIRWAVIGPCRFESGHRQFGNFDFAREMRQETPFSYCERSRMEAQKNTVDSSDVRQLISR